MMKLLTADEIALLRRVWTRPICHSPRNIINHIVNCIDLEVKEIQNRIPLYHTRKGSAPGQDQGYTKAPSHPRIMLEENCVHLRTRSLKEFDVGTFAR